MKRTLDIGRRQDETTSRKFGDVFFERCIDDHVSGHVVLYRYGGLVCVNRHLYVVGERANA